MTREQPYQLGDGERIIIGDIETLTGCARIGRAANKGIGEIAHVHHAAARFYGAQRQRHTAPDGIHQPQEVSAHVRTVDQRRPHDHDLTPGRVAETHERLFGAPLRAAIGVLRLGLIVLAKRSSVTALGRCLDAADKHEARHTVPLCRRGEAERALDVGRPKRRAGVRRIVLHDMHTGRKVNEAIRLEIRRPGSQRVNVVRARIDPLGHTVDTAARPTHETGHTMPGVYQSATQRPPDKAVRPADDHVTHSHFQPKRLKNLMAEAANIRTCAKPLRAAPPPWWSTRTVGR